MLAFALGLLPAAYLIWRPAHARWLRRLVSFCWRGAVPYAGAAPPLCEHPRFARGSLEACRLDSRHPLFRPAVGALRLADAPPAALWARRSAFSFGRQSLLVTEVFSPAIAGLRSTHTA